MEGRGPVADSAAALSERSEDIRHRIRERAEGFPLLAASLSPSLTAPQSFHPHPVLIIRVSEANAVHCIEPKAREDIRPEKDGDETLSEA